MNFILIDDLEEVFGDDDYLLSLFSDDAGQLYDYAALSELTNDQLIWSFIEEKLNGDTYNGLASITAFEANSLLRQMAMFRKEGKKKQHKNSSTEAKHYTSKLLHLLGNKIEYYSNVNSIDNPHDHPGHVEQHSEWYGTNDSICFIAINEKHFLFIEQTFNYQSE